jgi:hypothetical protein
MVTNLEEHDELHKLCILILNVPPVVDHRRYRHCEQELHSTPKFCTTNLNAMQLGRIDEGHSQRPLLTTRYETHGGRSYQEYGTDIII